MTTVDTHPSGSILSAGNIWVAPLVGSRVPTEYTITISAAIIANATSASLSSSSDITVSPGLILDFGGTKLVVAEEKALTSTPTAVAIQPAPDAVAANATATTLNEKEIEGVRKVGRPRKMNTIDIRSLKSGLGMEKRPTSVEFAFPIEGWLHQDDKGYREVLSDAADTGTEVWVIIECSDNTRYKGAAIVIDTDSPVEVDKEINWSATVCYQGIPDREPITV